MGCPGVARRIEGRNPHAKLASPRGGLRRSPRSDCHRPGSCCRPATTVMPTRSVRRRRSADAARAAEHAVPRRRRQRRHHQPDLAFYGDLAFVGTTTASGSSTSRPVACGPERQTAAPTRATCRSSTTTGGCSSSSRSTAAVTAPDCTARTPRSTTSRGTKGSPVTRTVRLRGAAAVRRHRSGEPEFVAFYRTACGSHTHTLGPWQDTCTRTSRRIRSAPDHAEDRPEGRCARSALRAAAQQDLDRDSARRAERVVREGASSDTEGSARRAQRARAAVQACHDHQAFLREHHGGLMCGDLQYWSIAATRRRPTASRTRTSRRSRGVREVVRLHAQRVVTWDGKSSRWTRAAAASSALDGDETRARLHLVLPLVEPGTPLTVQDELGRYIIPRAQARRSACRTTATCCRQRRRYTVQAFYQGGNTGSTSPTAAPDEIGSPTWRTARGGGLVVDVLVNGVVWVNGGLTPEATGFDPRQPGGDWPHTRGGPASSARAHHRRAVRRASGWPRAAHGPWHRRPTSSSVPKASSHRWSPPARRALGASSGRCSGALGSARYPRLPGPGCDLVPSAEAQGRAVSATTRAPWSADLPLVLSPLFSLGGATVSGGAHAALAAL